MTNIIHFPQHRQQHKGGIVGLFWTMPAEHRRQRIATMLRAGFDQHLVRDLTTRPLR